MERARGREMGKERETWGLYPTLLYSTLYYILLYSTVE
jgi:hypothetical protein